MTSPSSRRLWAVAQMTGVVDVTTNLEACRRRVARAAALGCELVSLPENCTFMGRERDKRDVAEPVDGPTVSALAAMAAEHRIFVHAGSVVEASAEPGRPYSAGVVLGPDGALKAHYRKIHLFDVEVTGDRSYRESDSVMPGEPEAVVVVDVNGLKLGLSICYDLRFPWLFQALRRAGAEVVAVPAAFTVPTGHDHWEVLLRARAIEAQAYVIAAAQYGRHETGRRTFGRSIIADPWGTVLARVPDGGELAVAELDPARIAAVRARMPMASRDPSQV